MESYIFLVFIALLCTVVFLMYYLYIPKVNVVQTEVWPWVLTPYSFWPYWFGGGYSSTIHTSSRRYSNPWGGEGRVANGLHSVHSHGGRASNTSNTSNKSSGHNGHSR
jgi:hypothetical protein